MTDFDKMMETELLKRVSEKGKINLMTETNSIMNSGQLSCLCHSSLAAFVQKQFIESNLLFHYDLVQSRNGIKIAGLSKGYTPNETDLDLLTSFTLIDESRATHILNQFYDVKDKVEIIDITAVYNSILYNVEKINLFICLNEELIDIIYKNSSKDFTSRQHVEKTIKDIIKYGYCFKRNDEYYWKMYKTNIQVDKEEIDQFFTIINEELEIIEEEKPVVIQEKIVNKEFTAQEALNFLAKELGLVTIEKTESKLEEVLAITNELIDNFDSMQDWEKLMNWKKFVTDWKTIMGDAMNGNS